MNQYKKIIITIIIFFNRYVCKCDGDKKERGRSKKQKMKENKRNEKEKNREARKPT